MIHHRTIVRNAVVARLVSAVTAAGSRVTSTRVEPHRAGQLPAISVYTLSESVRPESAMAAPLELTRDLKLEIAGWVAHTAEVPVDEAMDSLAAEIERAMDANRYLGGELAESVLESTEMSVRDDADPIVGIVTLTYAVMYRTQPAVGALDEFLRAGTTTQVAGSSVDNAAHDVIAVRL
jgi:hypothetical protein